MVILPIIFSNQVFLAYRNAFDFSISILYPATLLKFVVTSNDISADPLGFSTWAILPCPHNLFHLFLSGPYTYDFPCNTLARTSVIMLNDCSVLFLMPMGKLLKFIL